MANNYFAHDSNARNSDRLIPLRAKLGAEGYGVYFMILERLREEPDYTSVKDYNMLAFDFRVDAAVVKAVVETFGLFSFTDDGKRFYSEGFKKRMQLKDAKSEKARQSARARWERKDDAESDMQTQCESNANASKNDAIKEKESKENIILSDNNSLSPSRARKTRSSKSPESATNIDGVSYSPPDCAPPPDQAEALQPVQRLREAFNRRGETFAWLIVNTMRSTANLTPGDVWQWLNGFTEELLARGEALKSQRDYQSHFVNWLRIQLEKKKSHGNHQNSRPAAAADALSANERRYGSTRAAKQSIEMRLKRLSDQVETDIPET